MGWIQAPLDVWKLAKFAVFGPIWATVFTDHSEIQPGVVHLWSTPSWLSIQFPSLSHRQGRGGHGIPMSMGTVMNIHGPVGILWVFWMGVRLDGNGVKHAMNVVFDVWISPNTVQFLIYFRGILLHFLSLLNTHSNSVTCTTVFSPVDFVHIEVLIFIHYAVLYTRIHTWHLTKRHRVWVWSISAFSGYGDSHQFFCGYGD